ncbi:MAG: helix-turn-helix domain-containing protein, partial [Solirubrobacteraceae bacterium]
MPPPPWATLPPELAVVLRPVLPRLAEEVIATIGREVDDYRRPLEGDFGRNVRGGVEFALGRFLDLFGDAEREPGDNRNVYVQLGRGEFREGRSLDALLNAYRLGARVSWRRFVEAGREADVDPDVLFGLGEAIFAYIDGLSAESTEGYADAQSEA